MDDLIDILIISSDELDSETNFPIQHLGYLFIYSSFFNYSVSI